MKKIKINYLFILIGYLLIILINYYLNNNDKNNIISNISTSKTTVEIGDITSSIETSGSAILANEQAISFNQIGKVTNVYFKEGDSIKSGEVIAKLDDTDGQNSIKQSQISLENAKISLNALYEEIDESKILSANNSIENTKKSIEIAKKELINLETNKKNGLIDIENNISNLKKELINLEESLSQSENELELLIKSNSNNLENTINNKNNSIIQIQNDYLNNLIQLSQIIEKMDILLGVSELNKSQNDDYEIYLGAKNNTIKTNAISGLREIIINFDILSNKVKNFNINSTTKENIELIEDFIKFYSNLYLNLEDIYQTVINSVETNQLTNSMIEGFKSNILNYKNTTTSKISSLNSNINTLKNLSDTDLIIENNNSNIISKKQNIDNIKLNIEKKNQDIKIALNNYETKKVEYDLNIESKNNSIINLEKTLEINEISLKELLSGPTNENVTKAKNNIKQAELNLENSKKSLEKYEIIAPFDGVIRKIDYKIGDNLLSDTNKSVYIENPNLMEIIVYLDQVDIINVEKNNKSYVTFDGYSNIKVQAKISNIDTTPITNSGVVTYKVTIILDDENFDKKILSGMTANVEIITKELNNILLIESSYILSENEKFYVNRLENNKEVKTYIEIGEIKNGKTQIISGLNKGDIIIKSINNDTIKSTKSEGTNLLNIGGQSGSSRGQGGFPGGGF
ncbi:MAG: efflux RND transporter periplasmic adaptor subunit [Candidatus Gracilibacteria bacterium]|nr:efflux RND transporter periplasmic adaptor subunit [Candidatus Gracilibacteria bacterium]